MLKAYRVIKVLMYWNLFTYYAVTISFHDTISYMIGFRGPIPSDDHGVELGMIP